MNLILLSQILLEPRIDSYPVAQRDRGIITFSQFRADVAGVATRLKECRRATLACTDSYYFLVGMYALLQIGAAVVLPAGTKHVMREKLNSHDGMHVDDDFIGTSPQETARLVALDPLQPAFEFFTSGSTGEPKVIRKSLRMLENEIAILHAFLGHELGNGAVFATVPHQHLYGLIFKILWPLASGRAFCTQTHAFWEMLLPELTTTSTLVSSPSHLGRLGGMKRISSVNCPQHVFSAGAALPFTASEQSNAVLGCMPTEIFGSTETGAIATRCQKNADEPWQLLPDISMECDIDNRLVLYSPCIGSEAFRTDDIVEPLVDGFRFLGRADRIVKIEGKRISLAEVESALLQLDWVDAAAAIVLPADSPQLAAALVLSPEGLKLLDKKGKFRFGRQLRQELALTQEPMAIPRSWRFIQALPTGNLGKICMTDLLTLFG